MKFTLSWLKDHLETEASLDEIVTTLTRIGLEVEGVEDRAKRLAGFSIAYVISAQQHPNADKLRVCMVDTGSGEPVQVVCGAPNARTGMKSVFSPPGTYIPAKNITLTVAPVRGLEPVLPTAQRSVADVPEIAANPPRGCTSGADTMLHVDPS